MSTGANPSPSPEQGDRPRSCASASDESTSPAIDPPATPGGESDVFNSPLYKNLGRPGAPVSEKVRAGFKLIDAQKRDLTRMHTRLAELEKSLADRNNAINQLYEVLEQIQPLLSTTSGVHDALSAEEADLIGRIEKLQLDLGLPLDDTVVGSDRVQERAHIS